MAGVAFATWASRIADIKAVLGLSAAELGVTLLAVSAGSLIAMPLAGRIVHRLGMLRAIGASAAIVLAGFAVAAVAVDLWQSRVGLATGLALLGLGIGVWDVAMNLEGAHVERLLGVSAMPHFHAAFSGGTVVSGLIGAGMSRLEVALVPHFAGAVVLGVVAMVWALPRFVPLDREEEPGPEAGKRTPERSAWTEPRTLLIGVLTFVAAFTEGTANDWLAVAFHEGHGVPRWGGVLAFASFLFFMTVGRLVGTHLLDRYGRVPVLRVLFLLALAGSALVVFGNNVLAYVGTALWGVGVSLGFPVGMSASADDPARAPARMSVVATIGYAAFISGPPLLGFLGDQVGVLQALSVVGVMALFAQLVIPAAREPQPAHVRPERTVVDPGTI
ncbi:MAG: MFS transporter [Tetrasphaera sp.]|nr:MFS transporter [Tetrasphaera sp.]